MSDEAKIIEQLRGLLDAQRFGALGTCAPGGHPYASLVAFAATEDLSTLVFATLRATRKFANLSVEPRVSMLVDSRSNRETDLQAAAAVTILGRASEASGAEREEAASLLLDKHPAMREFVASPGCAVLRLAVTSYSLVSRFQHVVEVHVTEGGVLVGDTPPR
jgi:nitroimidazol reductase NimA-like FMN-containing flavoprotein (pyridoxamine 5'-phosphate oxidase superfamily)